MLPESDIVSLFLNQIYHQSLPPFRFLRKLFIFKFINLFYDIFPTSVATELERDK
jgi:hypothetical protein